MPETTMLAPRFVGQGRIELAERPVPTPAPGELLLRLRANALCGSERGQFRDGSPVTPGHEAAGVVAAAGAGAHTPPGTPGVVYLMDFCGACRSCRLGFTNQCLAKRGDFGFSRDGGYSPYATVSENAFFPLPAGIDPVEATLLLDVMGTGGHTIARARLVRPDVQSLLITGAGPVGLGVAAMARLLLGAETPVLVADTVPYRLTLAERLGARPIDLGQGTVADGLRCHGLAAVDAAVDASGKAVARRACLSALAKRGVLVCAGHGEGLDLDVSAHLIGPERAVLGSEYFAYSELATNLPLLLANRAYLGTVITHRYPIADLESAYAAFWGGDTGKVVAYHDDGCW